MFKHLFRFLRRETTGFILTLALSGGISACRNLSPVPPSQTPSPTPLEAITPVANPAILTPALAESRIAFESNRTGNWDIYVTSLDGTVIRNLTDAATSEGDAAWSPDGQQIAFVSNRDGNWEIYAMDAEGGNVRRLTDDPAIEADPAWSPDGSKIVFASDRGGSFDIYVMDSSGANPRRLMRTPGVSREPVWSPDGREVAFTSWRDGNSEIYVLEVASGDVRRLTAHEAEDKHPSWSPDGAYIAFESNRDGNWELYVVGTRCDSQPCNPIRLTFYPEADEDPAWSPDGSYIVFSSLREGNRELYLVPADGTLIPRRLTVDCGRDLFPVWSPGSVDLLPVMAAPPTRLVTISGENRVNLRGGPGTAFEVVSDAGASDCLTVIGRNRDDGWLQVRTALGKEAWVAAHLTDITGDLSSVPVTEARG